MMFPLPFAPSSRPLPSSTSKHFSTPEKTFRQHFTHLQKMLITSVIMNVRSFVRHSSRQILVIYPHPTTQLSSSIPQFTSSPLKKKNENVFVKLFPPPRPSPVRCWKMFRWGIDILGHRQKSFLAPLKQFLSQNFQLITHSPFNVSFLNPPHRAFSQASTWPERLFLRSTEKNEKGQFLRTKEADELKSTQKWIDERQAEESTSLAKTLLSVILFV